MNYSMIRYTLGWILRFEAIFLLLPLITAIYYGESAILAFSLSIAIALLVGIPLALKKPAQTTIYAKDGFVIVALSWIVLSLFGSFPFLISGATGSFVDALFETVSGFTTTGASIFNTVEDLPRSILMWRSFTHWIGGMGVLVFVMAFLPLGGGQNMHIMRAESPGPSVSKLVPRVKYTAIILYIIYFALTVIMFVSLLISGMNVFESINTAFSTAGTGGYGFKNDSFASATVTQQIIVTVFMLIFSVNFNSYYLLLRGKLRDAINTEVIAFIVIVVSAVTIITFDIMGSCRNVGDAINQAAFSVASLISTTGFTTANFDLWPELSKSVLVMVMFIGACAGSTGGGIKVSRILILIKGIGREIATLIHPRQVKKITIDRRPVEHEVIRSVNAYIACYFVIFAASLILLSFDKFDLVTTFTSAVATLNNVGPGLADVGPVSNYSAFTPFSKIVLIFNMLAGRLELFPMLLLFSPATWRKT